MFKLLGDLIAVKKQPQKKNSLIIIPNEKEPVFTGEVFLIGPGQTKIDGTKMDMIVKPGDTIMYMSTVGYHVTDPKTDETYTLLYERDVICILDKEV